MSNKAAKSKALSKKELADAGRRKLEAFRKKKASDKAGVKEAEANGGKGSEAPPSAASAPPPPLPPPPTANSESYAAPACASPAPTDRQTKPAEVGAEALINGEVEQPWTYAPPPPARASLFVPSPPPKHFGKASAAAEGAQPPHSIPPHAPPQASGAGLSAHDGVMGGAPTSFTGRGTGGSLGYRPNGTAAVYSAQRPDANGDRQGGLEHYAPPAPPLAAPPAGKVGDGATASHPPPPDSNGMAPAQPVSIKPIAGSARASLFEQRDGPVEGDGGSALSDESNSITRPLFPTMGGGAPGEREEPAEGLPVSTGSALVRDETPPGAALDVSSAEEPSAALPPPPMFKPPPPSAGTGAQPHFPGNFPGIQAPPPSEPAPPPGAPPAPSLPPPPFSQPATVPSVAVPAAAPFLAPPPAAGPPPGFGASRPAPFQPPAVAAKYAQPPWGAAHPMAPAGPDSSGAMPKLFVPGPLGPDARQEAGVNAEEPHAEPWPQDSAMHDPNQRQEPAESIPMGAKPGRFSSMFKKLANTVAPSAPAPPPAEAAQAQSHAGMEATAAASPFRRPAAPTEQAATSFADAPSPGRASMIGRFANAVVSAAAPPAPPAPPSSAAPALQSDEEPGDAVVGPTGEDAPGPLSAKSPDVLAPAATAADSAAAPAVFSPAVSSTPAPRQVQTPQAATSPSSAPQGHVAAERESPQAEAAAQTQPGAAHARSRSLFGRLAEVVSEAAAPPPGAGTPAKQGHARTDSSAWLDELVATNLGPTVGEEAPPAAGGASVPDASESETDELVIPSWVNDPADAAPPAGPPAPLTSLPLSSLPAGGASGAKRSLASKYSMLSDSYLSAPAPKLPKPDIPAAIPLTPSLPNTTEERNPPVGNAPAELAPKLDIAADDHQTAADSDPPPPLPPRMPLPGDGPHASSGPPSTAGAPGARTPGLPPFPRRPSDNSLSALPFAQDPPAAPQPYQPLSWASLPRAPSSTGRDAAAAPPPGWTANGRGHAEAAAREMDRHAHVEGHSAPPVEAASPASSPLGDGRPDTHSQAETPRPARRPTRDPPPPPEPSNQFKELQQYIDDLTQEKYEMQRGMEQQSKLAASLASENEQLTQDFNNMGSVVQDLRKQVAKYESEIGAQMLALDSLARERDGTRSGAVESNERAKALASEVVSLEEQVLSMRSTELKLGAELERAQEAQARMAKQLAGVAKERKNLLLDMEALKEEKLALAVKLRRATVAAQLDDGASRGGALPAPATDSATQTDAAAAPEATARPEAAEAPPPQHAAEVTAVAGPAVEVSHAEVQTEAVGATAMLSDMRRSPSKAAYAGDIASRILADAVTLERLQSAESPSARVASSALHLLSRDAKDAAAPREMPLPLPRLPPELSRLLPATRPWMGQGPGAMAVALGEEEKRVVGAINALLDRMEEQRRGMARRLKESKAESAELRSACDDLRSKLEVTTQRLELAISHSLHSQGAGAPAAAYSGRSGAALAHDDEQAGLGWLMGIFSRRKRAASLE